MYYQINYLKKKKKFLVVFMKRKISHSVSMNIKAEFPKKHGIIFNNYSNKNVLDCVNDLESFHESFEKIKNV